MTNPSYRIVDYDHRSPALFEEEKARILTLLEIDGSRLAHIGSTAVPGLASKPIIDLMVGIPAIDGAGQHVELLRGIGYEHRGETVPGTLYLRKAAPHRYNLHMTTHESEFCVEHLLFRDYLRAHPAIARKYEELKRTLMGGLAHDSPAYNDGKATFIASVVAMARAGNASGPRSSRRTR